MRISSALIAGLAFAAAGGIATLAAAFLATAVEDSTEISVRRTLDLNEHGWAEVEADGLRVIVSGTAPDEARRFAAVTVVGEVVDSARIINEMDVTPAKELAPPRFSVEILRNNSGISAIGLIPADIDRAGFVANLTRVAGSADVSDFMESAAHPVPKGWGAALEFTVTALAKLPRSKISAEAGKVTVTAIAESPEEKRQLEAELRRAAPPGLRVSLDISAPRPVITPFTLRYLLDESGGRFDSCSADSPEVRDRILATARATGGAGGAPCVIGLGVPSPEWGEATARTLKALSEIGRGSVTFADADITLVAAEGTPGDRFDAVIGELEAALPDAFVLHAVLPAPEGDGSAGGPPEFTITLSPEGLVQLRGRLNDAELQRMADSYAKARFGSKSVYSAARTDAGLPANWPVRVLTGIEALSRLTNGAVTVTPELVSVKGVSTRDDVSAEISGLLSQRLGDAEIFELDIGYQPPPPPKEEQITPEMCEAEIAEIQRTLGKITFDPGSANIAEVSIDTMDAIAELLGQCGEMQLEIQGHTDSQGRTSMNQQLSQERAQTVLNELMGRRVLTSSYSAIGYGEAEPIADNKTEEGREANRRIEFRLILPEPVPETQTTLEAVAQTAAPEDDAQGETETEEEADSEQN